MMLHDVLRKINIIPAETLCARLFIGPHARMAVTLNPEMALALRGDSALRDAVMNADICLPDGMGIVYAARLFGVSAPDRISGIDFAETLFAEPPEGLQRIFLLGGQDGVAETAARNLGTKFPHIEFAGFSDIVVDQGGRALDPAKEATALKRLSDFRPEMLLVGFGVPKQEKWIARNLGKFPSLRIAMGIGGAVDVWAGRLPRAPKIMRAAGVEWLWRLLLEPKRLPRIINAVVIFSFCVLFEKVRIGK